MKPMANQSDIFSRLQEHEVLPPAEVYQHLLDRLQAEMAGADDGRWQGSLQGLQELEVQPPAFMALNISKAVSDKPLLSFLQQTAVTPPAGAFDSIWQKLSASHKTRSAISFTKIVALHKYKAIAAVLLLVFAGWAVYRFTTPSSNKPPVELVRKTTPKILPVTDSVKQPATPAAPDMARHQLYDNSKTENFFKNSRFTTEGLGFPLVDNDFFVTFASFRDEALPSFLTNEESTKLVLRLDQYSYFTISPNMMDMLKKMYQRRSRGTPTRRARKEKERLEKWRKAEEALFDRRHNSNPLDPIDLSEFIFK